MKQFPSSIQKLITLSVVSFGLSTAIAKPEISVSGFSSGGFMAVQMGTIFSSEISAVGTAAGGFFYCAENHLQEKIEEGKRAPFLGTRNLFLFQNNPGILSDVFTGRAFRLDVNNWVSPAAGNPNYTSVSICMQNPKMASLPSLKEFEEKGLIDSIENLKNQRIYIYHGKSDALIHPEMSKRLKEYYISNGVDERQIQLKNISGGHNIPTNNSKLGSCQSQTFPYLSSCDFNMAEELLKQMTGDSLARAEANLSHLYRVDQNLIPVNEGLKVEDWKSPASSLGAYGYLYANDACLKKPGSCKLHIALHGCEMSDSFDPQLDLRYSGQVAQSQVVNLVEKNSDLLWYWMWAWPTNEQRKLSYSTLKFATQSGYIEMAEKNNLMILFPQTWISSASYPYNPKGCWDWVGFNEANYATNKGTETSWLIRYAKNIMRAPKKYIMSNQPELDQIKNSSF